MGRGVEGCGGGGRRLGVGVEGDGRGLGMGFDSFLKDIFWKCQWSQ